MFVDLKQLLSRFKVPPSARKIEQEAAALITEKLAIPLEASDLRYREGIFYIAAVPMLHSELLLRRQPLLTLLKEHFGDRVSDIR